MRIVLVIGSLGGGGAERVMSWLASSLVEHGHMVTLLTMHGPEDDRYSLDPRVNRQSMRFRRYLNSSKISVIVNALRWHRLLIANCCAGRTDVVLSFIDSMNVSCLTSLLGRRVPVVVAERSDPALAPISPLRAWLRPWLYRRRAAGVVFQTLEIAERFAAEWELSRVRVIPNPVLPNFTKLGSGGLASVVLSVGRLDPLKGHDILLEAWRRLGADRRGWRLRIVGDGPELERYQGIVGDHGLFNSVEFVPFTKDVAAAYVDATIFVLPSRVEGFPNALIEALAMGNAVIASDLPPACREIVTHDVNGLLYDGTSPEQLAAALRRLIDDAETRSRLSKAAREVRARYAETRIFRSWEQCLAEACE